MKVEPKRRMNEWWESAERKAIYNLITYNLITVTAGWVRCTRHHAQAYLHSLLSSLQLSKVGVMIPISQWRKARANENMLHPNIPFE